MAADESRSANESRPAPKPEQPKPEQPKQKQELARESVLALRVPADPRGPVEVVAVMVSAVALSEQIGGGLLDDSCYGEVNGQGYTVYLDEDRVAKSLPDNPRAAVLAARLGQLDRGWQAALRGDVLLVGLDGQFQDADVPPALITAARRAGVLRTVPPEHLPPTHTPAGRTRNLGATAR